MHFGSLVAATASLLAGIVCADSAHAQYLLSPGPARNANGGQLQIGLDVPMPGSEGVFLGGRTPVQSGTMGGGTMTGLPPDGPGPTFWPTLLIHRNPASMGTIMEALTTAQGGAITVPPGVLTNRVGGVPRAPVATFPLNPNIFMVRTTANFAWPAASAVFAPGGGPGIPDSTLVLTGPGLGTISYRAGTKSFGGSGQFAMAPGPFAGTVKVPPGGTMGSKIPVLSRWLNAGKLPASATRAFLLGAWNPAGVAAPGASLAAPVMVTMFGPVPLAIRQLSGMLPIVGPMGTIPLSMSTGLAAAPGTNQLTGSKGFPWTTGHITITAPGGPPFEVFFQSGRDDRVGGMGNISMVSGALSLRKITAANANRGWVSLTIPEPAAAFGALAALAVLVLCHALARRWRFQPGQQARR